MKLINSSAEIYFEDNPFKKIEKIGRTCYKSEDKITYNSCYKFVDGLISRQHYAMLEHAWFTFLMTSEKHDICEMMHNIPFSKCTKITNIDYVVSLSLSHLAKEYDNKDYNIMFHSLFNIIKDNCLNDKPIFGEPMVKLGGINIIYLNNLPEVLELLIKDNEERTKVINKHTFLTFKFICDRGVSHELVRHRASFAQESTRYCNYNKDKFGREITFIYPNNYNSWDEDVKLLFEGSLKVAEMTYQSLIDKGMTPQQARAVLPNALKTEVFMTYNLEGWDHFFNMRSVGTTGAPHPDMKEVADEALNLYRTYLNNIFK